MLAILYHCRIIKFQVLLLQGGEIVNFLHFDESGKILLVSSSTLSPNSYPHPLHTTHNINTHKTPNVNTYSLLISCLMKNSTLANSTPHLWHYIKIANERNNLHSSLNPNLKFEFWNWVHLDTGLNLTSMHKNAKAFNIKTTTCRNIEKNILYKFYVEYFCLL